MLYYVMMGELGIMLSQDKMVSFSHKSLT